MKKKLFSNEYLAEERIRIIDHIDKYGATTIHLIDRKLDDFHDCVSVKNIKELESYEKDYDVIECGCGG